MLRRVLLAAALSAAFVSVVSAATVGYSAKLSGSQEVPKTDSNGTGKLEGTFDTKTKELKYTLTFDGLSGPATEADFHGVASGNENAGVIAPIGATGPTSPISGSVTLTDVLAQALRSGTIYVNVHTAANPNGEIRGQINPLLAQKTATKKTTTKKTSVQKTGAQKTGAQKTGAQKTAIKKTGIQKHAIKKHAAKKPALAAK